MNEVTAYLTAFRFMLELLLANGFVHMRPEAIDKFIADVKAKNGWLGRGPMDVETMQEIDRRSAEIIAELLDAAKARVEGKR